MVDGVLPLDCWERVSFVVGAVGPETAPRLEPGGQGDEGNLGTLDVGIRTPEQREHSICGRDPKHRGVRGVRGRERSGPTRTHPEPGRDPLQRRRVLRGRLRGRRGRRGHPPRSDASGETKVEAGQAGNWW